MSRLIRTLLVIAATALPLSGGICSAETPRVSVEALLGGAVNIPTLLSVVQDGQPDISLTARYSSKPFETPLHYSLRFGIPRAGHAWELELIHQKLFLDNRPDEIQRFSVSHGYNVLTVNHAWQGNPVTYRLGAGVVIAHEEAA